MSITLHDKQKLGWFKDINEIFGQGLKPYELAVRFYLSACADNISAIAYPAISTIAKAIGASERLIYNAINSLVEKGWLEKKNRSTLGRSMSNCYKLLVPYSILQARDAKAMALNHIAKEKGSE